METIKLKYWAFYFNSSHLLIRQHKEVTCQSVSWKRVNDLCRTVCGCFFSSSDWKKNDWKTTAWKPGVSVSETEINVSSFKHLFSVGLKMQWITHSSHFSHISSIRDFAIISTCLIHQNSGLVFVVAVTFTHIESCSKISSLQMHFDVESNARLKINHRNYCLWTQK